MSQQELLRKLEQRLTSEYKDTEAVIRAKIAYFTEDFDKDNKLHQKMVKDGVMSRQEYKRWYKDQMFAQKWANKMTTVISEDLTNANVTASKIINNNASAMFIDGATEAVKELQDYAPFEVFDTRQIKNIADENAKHLPESRVKIPKDQKWNEKRIKSSLMQSAVKGESAQQLAGRLLTVVGMNRKSAIRNARTMMTGSHNMGKLELGSEALEMGLDVRKKWIATFDNRTRNSHASLHGEVVDMDEEFSNGLMFPADPEGDPAEVYNCRCTMVITHDPKRGGMSKEEFEQNVAENEAEKEAFKQANKDLKNGVKPQATQTPATPPEPFVEAKTKAEAVEYAHKFADNVNYDGISLKNANAINEQLNELTQKYPINRLDNINSGSRGVMSANWHSLNINGKKLGKVLDDEEINFNLNQAMAKAKLKQLQDRLPTQPKNMQEYTRRQIDQLERDLKYSRWGVHSSYPDHVKCVVTHEYGHILSDQYFGMLNKGKANSHLAIKTTTNYDDYIKYKNQRMRIQNVQDSWEEAYNQARKTGDIYQLSRYGATNSHEFFAEVFLAREMGEKLPKYIDKLMEETLRNGIL